MAATPGGLAGPGAGYPQWYFNTTTHEISEVTSSLTKGIAETVSFPAKLVFFTSDAAAQAYAKGNGGGIDISKIGAPVSNATNSIANAATNVIPGLGQIGGFFSSLSQKNTWIRVLKVVAGGALVIIGLSHMTGSSDAVSTAARKVPIIV